MTGEQMSFLAAPFVMSLILAGIHCYLGLHVLARGVIFVDLSLAQVAAFGATMALLWGFEHGSTAEYLTALLATFLAAGLFAVARRHERKMPQEAIIGVIYALSSAAVVLVVDRMAHGSEHIKDLMVGQVLWVRWEQVVKTAIVYAGVGGVHFVFRKQFLATSFGTRASPFWDFVFYALFGVVITSSVGVAGVLQVFAYLIVPAMVATLFVQSLKARLLLGWAFSAVLSFLGLWLSALWDLPTGALTVVLFGAVPVLLLLWRNA